MIKDLVIQSRSYRKFDESVPIPAELLADLVDTARFTPASVNIQPFKYHISTAADELAKVFSFTRWARLLKGYDGPAKGERPTGYITVLADISIAANPDRFRADMGIVAQTMLLAACEQGFGGCMIGNFDAEPYAEAMGFPSHLKPMLIIALGKPAETIYLEDMPKDGQTAYYRDEQDRHHVPKRMLKDLLV
ncbi:MAG TPA: nitroreductase family protein [Firmicutes bacterium]|nr:nitroreductase family protein [Bacillota bacterium]